MSNRCIYNLPKHILEKCFTLNEFSIFILPETYVYNGKYINNWKKVLDSKLYKINRRHSKKIDITMETFDMEAKELKKENIEVELSKLLELLMSILINDIIVFIKINNYNYQYGYLIIPGEQIIKNRIKCKFM